MGGSDRRGLGLPIEIDQVVRQAAADRDLAYLGVRRKQEAGLRDVVDSEDMFLDLPGRIRQERIIP